eukprot:281461-Hanusia_phi.AAC.1
MLEWRRREGGGGGVGGVEKEDEVDAEEGGKKEGSRREGGRRRGRLTVQEPVVRLDVSVRVAHVVDGADGQNHLCDVKPQSHHPEGKSERQEYTEEGKGGNDEQEEEQEEQAHWRRESHNGRRRGK